MNPLDCGLIVPRISSMRGMYHRPTVLPSSHQCVTRASVSTSGDQSSRVSVPNMLNQIA